MATKPKTSLWDWVNEAVAKGERENAALQQRIAELTAERDQARAERDELDAAVTVSADSEDMLFTRVTELEDMREDLERANARLRAALAEQWTPCANGHYDVVGADTIAITGDELEIDGSDEVSEPAYAFVKLPPHLRLCERRAPAQEE